MINSYCGVLSQVRAHGYWINTNIIIYVKTDNQLFAYGHSPLWQVL